MAFRARASSARSTTREMFRSEEPWAIARTLTRCSPRTLNRLPAIPGRWRILSPTAATTD